MLFLLWDIVARLTTPPFDVWLRDAAQKYEWRAERAEELPGVGEEEGLLEGVGAQETVTDEAEAQPGCRRQCGAELL